MGKIIENDTSLDNVSFDLDDILKEFGDIESESSLIEDESSASYPITDSSADEDGYFSALIDDRQTDTPSGEIYAFDKESVRREFDADFAESDSDFSTESILTEFEEDEIPHGETPLRSAELKPVSEHISVSDPEYDIDRIIAEGKMFAVQESESRSGESNDSSSDLSAAADHDEPVIVAGSVEADDMFTEGTVTYHTEKEDSADDIINEQFSDSDTSSENYADENEDFGNARSESAAEKVSAGSSKSFVNTVLNPIIAFMALIALNIQQSKNNLQSAHDDSEEDLGPEMAPDKAAKFYDSHIAGLRLRVRISFVISLILIYLSYGLPLFGSINDIGVRSAVCTVLLLTVMLLGLDIISSGIMSLVRRKPHANALIAISALLCVIDGIIIAAGVKDSGLPFSVVPALTITFSLLGSVMNCRSNRIIFNTAASGRNPYTVTAEASVNGDGITLLKSRRPMKDIVRRAEEAGPDEEVFSVMAPYLIAASLILGLAATIICKNFAGIAHILSGIFVCAAPAAMLLTFPLPFFVSVKGLIKTGSTIVGWSGLYDIGKGKHFIITDNDLFPKGTVKIGKIRFLSGYEPEYIVSLAGSIIAASGCSMAPAFTALLNKGNGKFMTVDNFRVHESGGLMAMIDGHEILCGDYAFMNLMSVMMHPAINSRNNIYIAVDNVLSGFFQIDYTATEHVKKSLETIMQTKRHPIFAVRDFNITPQMLSVKFDMATDGFDFPSFPERYEISGAVPSESSKPSALVSREGLGPYIELTEHTKNLFSKVKVNVLLSVLSSVIGIILMFILFLKGSMSVGLVLTFMLLWLLPVIIISFTMNTP